MYEYVINNIWQLLGCILVIAVPVGEYLIKRRRKRLSLEVISESVVASVQKGAAQEIQIYFRKEPINNVHLLVLRLFNSGNVPITKDDYDESVSIGFGDSASLLTGEKTGASPLNLDVSWKIRENSFVISPLLLNQGDEMIFNCLVAGYLADNLKVDTRIVGVKEVERIDNRTRVRRAKNRQGLLFGAIMIIIGIIGATLTPTIKNMPIHGPITIMIYVITGVGVGVWSRVIRGSLVSWLAKPARRGRARTGH